MVPLFVYNGTPICLQWYPYLFKMVPLFVYNGTPICLQWYPILVQIAFNFARLGILLSTTFTYLHLSILYDLHLFVTMNLARNHPLFVYIHF